MATREAVYTNLGPGSYRFHVIASNSSGLWNGVESAIAVDVKPAVWQTLAGFEPRSSCSLPVCGILVLPAATAATHTSVQCPL